MADTNLFEELKAVLEDFKAFLEGNFETIEPAVQAVAALIPQVNDLIDLLIDLLVKLRTEIENIDLSGIDGVAEFAEFTGKIPALLDAAKKLLPEEAESIDSIAGVVDVVTGLPAIDDVKDELIGLIGFIVDKLGELKP